MWFQKNKWKIIIPLLIAAALAAAFFFGGKAPDVTEAPSVPAAAAEAQPVSASGSPAATQAPASAAPAAETEPEELSPAPQETDTKPEASEPDVHPEAEQPAPETDPEAGKDQYLTDPVPEGKPLPVEPQEAEVSKAELKCTISISCATILNNMELCDAAKRELIPADGWILYPVEVTFYEGESVFNVLQRVCKQKKIHMEFENTPLYNSAYIEGIYNLYEFDVGELSGWMYQVNGWFPNYGCSRYQLQDGDEICWVYTCDLGYDVGGGYAVGE